MNTEDVYGITDQESRSPQSKWEKILSAHDSCWEFWQRETLAQRKAQRDLRDDFLLCHACAHTANLHCCYCIWQDHPGSSHSSKHPYLVLPPAAFTPLFHGGKEHKPCRWTIALLRRVGRLSTVLQTVWCTGVETALRRSEQSSGEMKFLTWFTCK